MLITHDFVMLNMTKTGSTFARTVIKELLDRRRSRRPGVLQAISFFLGLDTALSSGYIELQLPNLKNKGVISGVNDHGQFSQIPRKYLGKEVISIVRDPYARFMSDYQYRDWERYPVLSQDIREQQFPNFPDLSVDEYVQFCDAVVVHGRLGGVSPHAAVGAQTILFILMYFKNPREVLNRLTDRYLDSEDVFRDMADIHFLRQEHLSADLAAFLETKGYSAAEVQYVRNREKVNVTMVQSVNRDTLWTPKALAYIREKERMIFRILKTKGIVYDPLKFVGGGVSKIVS